MIGTNITEAQSLEGRFERAFAIFSFRKSQSNKECNNNSGLKELNIINYRIIVNGITFTEHTCF